jgi:hypothetical protein
LGVRWQEAGIWCDVPATTEWAAVFEWSADCNGDGIVDYGQIIDGTFEDADGNGVPDCCDAGVPCDGPWPITVDDDLADYPNADYTSIQEAVDAASNGDTVLVYPGTYTGSGQYVVEFGDKDLHLLAASGPDVTIIDGEDYRGLIRCNGPHEATVIEGFGMTRAGEEVADDPYLQGRIELVDSAAMFVDCVVFDIEVYQSIVHSGPASNHDNTAVSHFVGCVFRDTVSARVLNGAYSDPLFEDCEFRDNQTRGQLMFSYWGTSRPVLRGCTFDGNVTGTDGINEPGVLVARDGGHWTVESCVFAGNTMFDNCVIYGGSTISDTAFCGNIPGNEICSAWNDLGGNTFEDSCGPPCVADILEDGEVAIEDLLIVLAQYGTPGPEADIDGNGIVDVEDLLMLVGSWGACP